MKLIDFKTFGELRRRHLEPDALIDSPLPNLQLEPGAAVAEIVHHPMLEPINGSRLTGSSTLRLRGAKLGVQVAADRPLLIELRRGRMPGPQDGRLVLVATACGAAQPACVSSASFDLSMPDAFADLVLEDIAQLPACRFDALSQDLLQGLPTGGWLAGPAAMPESSAATGSAACDAPTASPGPAPEGDHDYLLSRIRDELRAALRANEPGVASRHVQIATLMARRLQGRPPANRSPNRRARNDLALYSSPRASEARRLP